MNSLLCPECDNLIQKETDTGQIKFICNCGFSRNAKPEDTLMASGSLVYQDETGDEYSKFLKNTAYLPTNPKPDPNLKIKCPKCKKENKGKETNIRYVRITENEKIYYVCKCHHIFT